MNTTPKISVIIPVYNSALFLEKCIESVINQSFRNIEIIIINDNSSDDSHNIISSYADRDRRIVYVTNSINIGQGESRNKGMEIASGEYISFVDSDDYLNADMYEKMILIADEGGADVVECNFNEIAGNCSNAYLRKMPKYINKRDNKIGQYMIFLKKRNLGVVVWNKLYRKNIIKKSNIKFCDNKIIYGEDMIFNMEVMRNVHHLVTINVPLYNYIVREGSHSNVPGSYNLEKTINVFRYFLANHKASNGHKSDLFFFSIIIISLIRFSMVHPIITEKNKILTVRRMFNSIREDDHIKIFFYYCLKNKYSTINDKIFSLLFIFKLDNVFLILVIIKNIYKKNVF